MAEKPKKHACSSTFKFLITGLTPLSQPKGREEEKPNQAQMQGFSSVVWWGEEGSERPDMNEHRQKVELFMMGRAVTGLYIGGELVEADQIKDVKFAEDTSVPGMPFRFSYTKVIDDREIKGSRLTDLFVTEGYLMEFDPEEFVQVRHPNDFRPEIKTSSADEEE